MEIISHQHKNFHNKDEMVVFYLHNYNPYIWCSLYIETGPWYYPFRWRGWVGVGHIIVKLWMNCECGLTNWKLVTHLWISELGHHWFSYMQRCPTPSQSQAINYIIQCRIMSIKSSPAKLSELWNNTNILFQENSPFCEDNLLVDSPHKGPVMWEMFSCHHYHDAIINVVAALTTISSKGHLLEWLIPSIRINKKSVLI